MDTLYNFTCHKVNDFSCLMDYNPGCNLGDMTLGERLKKARLAAGLTQRQLARDSGIKQQTISRLEVGLSSETTQIIALAKSTGVRPEWLGSEDGPMYLDSSQTETKPPGIPKDVLRMARLIMALPPNKIKALMLILGEKDEPRSARKDRNAKNVLPATVSYDDPKRDAGRLSRVKKEEVGGGRNG